MINVEQATEEKSIPIIENILMDAFIWLDGIGKPLWSKEQISWARLSRDFTPSDFYIAFMDGASVGCMALIDYDQNFWPDVKKGQSLFIHKLAVKRVAAGQGVSSALIDFAKNECIKRRIPALRLDTHALIPKLRAVYERNGFTLVEERVLFGKYHTAFYIWEIENKMTLNS
ncbi:MAG: GNAT family N-acetyltransferase [Oscillospiraceae bacterium]|nr:GNAT family N-acetyltransferase [Oscillospiraceae bacterium]